jgi:hypothetical protein
MTAEQRAAFERDGYLVIRGALCPDQVAGARGAVDRVYAARASAGSLGPEHAGLLTWQDVLAWHWLQAAWARIRHNEVARASRRTGQWPHWAVAARRVNDARIQYSPAVDTPITPRARRALGHVPGLVPGGMRSVT